MKNKYLLLVIIAASLLFSGAVSAVVAWPTTLTKHGDIMMATLPYEPSGLAWNPLTNKLLTVCNTGQITVMNMDGTGQVNTKMPSYMDFEAITIVDPNSTKVYIGDENPDAVFEYDLQTKALTGKSWNLTSVLTGADNQGLEGLTFVPNGYHPFPNSASGGVFYAGIQRPPVPGGATNDDYLLYAFDIDLNTSGKIVNWYGITLPSSIPNSDISDLYFNKDTGLLYVLFDGYDRLVEMKTDGTVVKDYSGVPVADQEGLVIKTNYPSLTADIYLGSDSGKLIGWYSGYPVDYDFDKDGVNTSLDCNDRDATISSLKTFYQDLDKDGLGSDVTISVCSLTPPSGYVTNSDDLNDNSVGTDLDKDGFLAGVDCNDNNPLLTVLKVYYKDADGDGMGLASQTKNVCSLTPPTGYVSNSSDKNDNDYDNDGVITSKDCNDKNSLYYTKKIYYRDKDGDGLGNKWRIGYYCVPPSGYVSNSLDKNDNHYDN